MDIKKLNEELDKILNEEHLTVQDIESLAGSLFQPLITFDEYTKDNKNCYVLNVHEPFSELFYITDLNNRQMIMGGLNSIDLYNKLKAIENYKHELLIGRNQAKI